MSGKITIHKRLRGEDGHRTFSIRIPEENAVALDKLAQETGHSRNDLINMFIAYCIKNNEIVSDFE